MNEKQELINKLIMHGVNVYDDGAWEFQFEGEKQKYIAYPEYGQQIKVSKRRA